MEDIRWKQRFENYTKALDNLTDAVQESQKRQLSNLERQGLVQAYEYTFELGWKTLKDYLRFKEVEAEFPRDVIKKSFAYELVSDGDVWMDMLEKRNLMAHTYNETNANLAFKLITEQYHAVLKELHTLLTNRQDEE